MAGVLFLEMRMSLGGCGNDALAARTRCSEPCARENAADVEDRPWLQGTVSAVLRRGAVRRPELDDRVGTFELYWPLERDWSVVEDETTAGIEGQGRTESWVARGCTAYPCGEQADAIASSGIQPIEMDGRPSADAFGWMVVLAIDAMSARRNMSSSPIR
jgi:hypothetical protein